MDRRLLLLDSEPFYGRLGLIPFLQRVWPLSQMPSRDYRFKDAEGDIWQHMVNNDDWTMAELLYDRLDLTKIPDEQFGRFLEYCLHPLTVPDRSRTEALALQFNSELRNDGFEMRSTSEISGRHLQTDLHWKRRDRSRLRGCVVICRRRPPICR